MALFPKYNIYILYVYIYMHIYMELRKTVMMIIYARQQKRHRYKEQTFRTKFIFK